MGTTEEKDLFFVAVKVFLRDGNKLLIIRDIFGFWDLPGGRIKKDEFDAPLEEVATRKMNEEVGGQVEYELGKPNGIFFRVERIEAGLNKKVRIFAVGYDARYLGGEIQTGEYIEKFEWVELRTFEPGGYFTGGWLKGVQEYLESVRKSRD